jgi:hypothetical protein
MYFFEHTIKCDDGKIKFIRKFKAFHVKIKGEKEGKSRWNAWNLIPSLEEYPDRIAMEYYYKMLCKMAADSQTEAKRIYMEEPLSNVWEMIAMNMAVSKAESLNS